MFGAPQRIASAVPSRLCVSAALPVLVPALFGAAASRRAAGPLPLTVNHFGRLFSTTTSADTLQQRADSGDQKAQLEYAKHLLDTLPTVQEPPQDEPAEMKQVIADIRAQQRANRQNKMKKQQQQQQATQEPLALKQQQIEKAREHLRKSGLPDAYVLLGNVTLEHYKPGVKELKPIVDLDPLEEEAVGYYEEARKHKHPDACYNLGMVYYHVDKKKAMQYFKEAADLEDPSAQYFYGHALRTGDGVERDVAQGLALVEAAAAQNHDGAQLYLSTYYREHHDNDKAEAMLAKAVENDNADALFHLADMYFNAKNGRERDYRKAFKLYQRAAAFDHVDAQVCVGMMLFHGYGVKAPDLRKAFLAYERAAQLGSVPAWKNLAHMYRHGLGVDKSEQTADFIERSVAG